MGDLTKALRLSQEEWQLISSFLRDNPVFDFSSLARTAIREFIHNPKLTLNAVNKKSIHDSAQRESAPRKEGPHATV